MFLVSMADIIGSYERLPNDAVRAVAVAKRREYLPGWKSEFLSSVIPEIGHYVIDVPSGKLT